MKFPLKVSQREKRFIIFGSIIVVCIIGYHLFGLYGEYQSRAKELTDARLVAIEKQMMRLAEKETLQKQAAKLKGETARFNLLFLQGSKPPVEAAELQNTLKNIATSLAIDIKQERALNPTDTGRFLSIPVEIGFTASTAGLSDFLQRIRNSPALLAIAEMKIRIINTAKPDDVNVTLIVTGIIRKEEEEKPKSEEGKNVT